jgi:hypothetical protein
MLEVQGVIMKRIASTLFVLACATAFAQTGQEDHGAHHPGTAASAAAGAAPAPAAPPANAGADKFSEQMGKMRGMHARLQGAKTPAERRALMDEHMKLMKDGMEMMNEQATASPMGGGMGGGMMMGMQRRMEMMETMMQMMVDREAAFPRK